MTAISRFWRDMNLPSIQTKQANWQVFLAKNALLALRAACSISFLLNVINKKLLFLATVCCAALAAQQVTVEHAVKATMRDGVVLRADIYRPSAAGRFPVLLQRTPYDKRGGVTFGTKAAAAGYVVIIQDTRGRYSSEGDFYPFRFESQDGYDTVEWAAALPYSNGKVGMYGGSYVGATQMLTAIVHPPHLAGICPVVTASNYHSNWTYQGGAFEQWFNESWTSGLAQDTLNRKVQADTNALEGIWKLPMATYPLFNSTEPEHIESTETLAPYFLDWLAHPTYDDYWKPWSIEDHYSDIQVPALHIAAWYDIFQGGSLRNYQGIKAHGGSEAARHGQHLLITIGGHAGGGRKIGDLDFGSPAEEYDEETITLQWYDYLFKGVQNRFAQKPVQLFVLGQNQWRSEDEWPLAPRTRNEIFSALGKKRQLTSRRRQFGPPSHRRPRRPTITSTIQPTRWLLSAAHCAATPPICRPAQGTSGRMKLATMFSFTRPSRSRKTRR